MGIYRNAIVVDTETTGLNPYLGHEIVQLSAVAINANDLSWHPAGEFNIFLKPNNPEKADPGALKVSGPSFNKAMKEGIDHKVGMSKFMEWCGSVNATRNAYGKPIIWGHNIAFDMKFIKHHAIKYGVIKDSTLGDREDYPWFLEFDTAQVLLSLFDTNPNVNDLKLNTALAQADLHRANADIHDAMEDVRLTAQFLIRSIKFYREMQKKMRPSKNNEIPV